jgi:exosortase O
VLPALSPPAIASPERRLAPAALANAALLGAWLALHAPALRWLGAHFARSPWQAGLLLAALALLARGVRREALAVFAEPPRPAALQLALAGGAAIGTLVLDRTVDISILAAALFGLGTYGLAGLYLDRDRFRRALPAALLLIALLPFQDQAEAYIGFSARVATARVVGDLLAALGFGAPPVETILVLENGTAHVDIPCSGLRSLWTGLLFLLAATCLLRRRIGARWALVGLFHAALLAGENMARVAAVVLLAAGLGLRRAADVIHVPLGVLGFALACAATLALLRRVVPEADSGAPDPRSEPARPVRRARRSEGDRRRPWIAPALAAFFVALAAVHVRRPAAAAPPAPPRLELPAAFHARPLPLAVAEADLFRRWGGAADKRRVRLGDHEGTLLAVFSRSWRAHHAPEICLAGSGVRIENLRDVALEDGAAVRVAAADGGRRTAIYWFQSPARTTGDLAARIWDEIGGGERRWVQISLLIDAPIAIESPEGRALVRTIHAAAARALHEEIP